MPAPSQLVVLSRQPAGPNGLPSLGTREEIVRSLANYNTAPQREGEEVLYGPGIRIELPPGQSSVNQMLLTLVEEEIAWLTIMRLARTFKWKLLDTATGRELTP